MKRTAHGSALVFAATLFCISAGGVFNSFTQTVAQASDDGAVTIPAGQKFIMRLETSLHTSTSRKGDSVEFFIASDVLVDDHVAIADKSLIRGTVTKAKRAGKLFGRAEISLRLDSVQLPDDVELPLKATIIRVKYDALNPNNGKEPRIQGDRGGTAGKVEIVASGAAQGALVGVFCGNIRMMGYGAATGAALSAAQIALQRGPDLDLPRRTMFEARLDKPMEIPAKSILAQNLPPAVVSAPEKTLVSAIAGGEASLTGSQAGNRSGTPPHEKFSSADPDALSSAPESAPAQTVIREEPSSAEIATLASPESHPDNSPPPLPDGSSGKTRANSPMLEVPESTIRVKVRMVQVDAVVRDRNGKLMGNLKADDFRIYEDGVQQEIRSFSQDKLPLSVALVVDRSGSVSPYISELRRIAIRALDQLKPLDEVCLFAFTDTVELMEGLTTDRKKIADATDRIRAGGMTNIADTLWEAVHYLAKNASDRRHAVILISDNSQTSTPRMDEADVIAAALETETVVYSLRTPRAPIPWAAHLPALLFNGDLVAKVTKETGGEVLIVEQLAAFDSAFGSIISHLRKRYLLAYYPSGTEQGGVFHEIKVLLSDSHGKLGRDYSVNAKRGYYVTSGSSTSTLTSNIQP